MALLKNSVVDDWLRELQMWAISCGASTWLIDLEPYVRARVAGIVARLRIDPIEGIIDATITDGTSSVLARWSTRDNPEHIPVIPGTGVALEGFASPNDDGVIALIDPLVETLPFPSPEWIGCE